jgi:hypothetical protein
MSSQVHANGRAAAAAAGGAVVALLLAYFAAVIMLLVTVGIPLGAQPRDQTAGEYAVLMLAAAAAAAVGTRVASRAAGAYRRRSTVILACALPPFVVWSFFNSPGWPSWWGGALGGAMLIGILAAGALDRRKAG